MNKKIIQGLLCGLIAVSTILAIDFILLYKNFSFGLTVDERKQYSLQNESLLVVTPLLTSNAYTKNGFYEYYNHTCGTRCLTVEINQTLPYTYISSNNLIILFMSLNASMISDYDLNKNLTRMYDFDRIVLLHNEYVTNDFFKAVQKHKDVIYLYPNSLYAEVKLDYDKNTMTLIKGHNYPDHSNANGFDWKDDNSAMEYNTRCDNYYWTKINNGYQLSCYPEYAIIKHKEIFDFIKNGGK